MKWAEFKTKPIFISDMANISPNNNNFSQSNLHSTKQPQKIP
jgi:hypothetical protein